VLVLGVAALGSREFDADRVQTMRQQARRAAVAAGQEASEALAAKLSELKSKADNAAANPRLVFALQGNVDERTLKDLWRTEEWWRPWRTEFKVYALAFTGVRLEVAEGIATNALDVAALIRVVRDRGEAAASLVTGAAGTYAAAATLATVPGRERPVILLLAKPFDAAALRALVDKSGGAVALVDEQKVLLDAGVEGERALLRSAILSASPADARAPLHETPDGSWAASRSPLEGAGSLALWAFASSGASAHDAESVANERKLTLWAVALLVAGVALLLGFRRTHAVAAAPATQRLGGPQLPATLLGNGPLAPHGKPPGGDVELATGHSPTMLSPVSPPLMPRPAPGEINFGRYTLLDRLGEGGMAEVYTAVTFGAEGFRRKFVIKRLRPELARETTMVDQFIDEANLASSMVHSNIVPVFDFGKVGDEYFIAQEYILGRDLARFTRQCLEREGQPAPVSAVLYVASETLKALEYAHTKTSESGQPLGIVHRDVSPTNVLVSARGEVKLFDFGIVKAEGRVTQTQSGVVKGNVTFMAPEQARGTQVDSRADLFSLGLVMYYMLAGHVLYAGATTYELLVRAASGPGPQELKQLQRLPSPCRELLGRALDPLPSERYQSAREFRDAITPHLGAGGAELASMIQRLFAEDFRVEENRFRAAGPLAGSPGGSKEGTPSPRRT
jgi:hypothetical protein